MVVRGLTHDRGDERAVLCLEDADGRLRLGLLIPLNEANRLARALGQTPCPCVPVFELVERLVRGLGARVHRVELDDDGGISGRLCVAGGAGEVAFPCHAADALALAARAGVPVYATDAVLRHAYPVESPAPSTGVADVRRWLEQLKPAHFGEPAPREPDRRAP